MQKNDPELAPQIKNIQERPLTNPNVKNASLSYRSSKKLFGPFYSWTKLLTLKSHSIIGRNGF